MSDFYNKYPYTDFHELNLDWVIERVKKLTEDWAATSQEWDDTEAAWNDLHDYVQNYFDNLNVQDEIDNKLQQMYDDGQFDAILLPLFNTYTQDINNRIMNIEQTAATPNFVPSTADMTDTSKFYVLTTNGHIYYYNNSWIDSGLIYGTGADTFTCGILQATNPSNPYNLNTLTNANKIYIFNGYVTNAPASLTGSVVQGIIITVNKTFSMQVIICSYSFYTRIAGSYPTFGPWSTPLETFAENKLYTYDFIHAIYADNPRDLNTLPFSDVIYEYTGYLSNAPFSGVQSGVIITTKGENNSHAYATQCIISGVGTYTRVYSSSWGNWIGSGFTSSRLEATNPSDPIDLNALNAADKIYSINGYFTNSPFSGILQGSLIYVNAAYKAEVLICNQGIAVRLGLSASNWLAWAAISSTSVYKRVYVGTGETYTSIVEAMRNETASNIEFYLKKGVYDIEAEYKASYGNNFFVDYPGYPGQSDPLYRGLNLRPGQRITGDIGAEIVFNPTIDYPNVQQYFSSINMTSDNIVENIIIRIKDNSCRYLIHDDFADSRMGTNIIRFCQLFGSAYSVRSIGGGMGVKNRYELHDLAIFTASGEAIDYHNSQLQDPYNSIYINNVYAPGAVISVTPIGDETYMTNAYITNCKCSEVRKNSTFPSNNITLYAWNNDTN